MSQKSGTKAYWREYNFTLSLMCQKLYCVKRKNYIAITNWAFMEEYKLFYILLDQAFAILHIVSQQPSDPDYRVLHKRRVLSLH